MSTLSNDLLLRTLRGESTERTPAWMMRQAGRYLPGYQRLKEKYSFFERCQNPELVSEITIEPVELIGVDAAIIFSDILVVPRAMGMEVRMIEGRGPILPDPIRKSRDLQKLSNTDVAENLSFVVDAIRLTKTNLGGRVPLIGFAGSPWTLLCYMVQGMGSKTFDEAKVFCFTQPELANQLLEMLTTTTIEYLKAQVRAGVDVVQIFDSWGGLLGPEDFEKFSLRYIRRIIESLKHETLTVVFAKGAWHSLKSISDTGVNGLGIDWTISAPLARRFSGPKAILQGNLDPAKLLLPIGALKKEVVAMLDSFGTGRHIANLGHGILPNTPVKNARAFVEAVKEVRGVTS